MTLEELRRHDGTHPDFPLRLAIRGEVFDVEPGRGFYAPGGDYHVFAGRECARALARGSLDPRDCVGDLRGLGPEALETLEKWVAQFRARYRVVGRIEPG